MSHEAREPVSLAPPNVDYLDQALIAAISHHQAGNVPEAEAFYRIILASSPGHAYASYGFGLLCAAHGRPREAIDAYRRAIAMRPDFVDAYINLGTAALAVGQPEEAIALYHRAIAMSPRNGMAHGNLGKAFLDIGRIDDAIASYRTALALQPDSADIDANFGAALLEQRAWGDSETVTRRAIALRADDAMACANLGTALLHLGRHEEALTACRQAAASQPRDVTICASLGGVMLELGASREAVALCRQAVTLDPDLPDGWFNLSHALKTMNHLEEAEAAARRAIVLRPDSADYHFHLAHILLLRGDMEVGWAEYDWRWKLPDFAGIRATHGEFSQPVWRGEDISGKTILILTEQGLGDIILFARYLPLVVGKAGRVIVAAHPPTCRLLETIGGLTIVSVREVPLPDFDVYCPLMSLPRAFGTRLDSIPSAVPYLGVDRADRFRWGKRIRGNGLRVGIVWAGNPATKRDRLRSPGLSSVWPLFSVPGIDFVVLQVGPGRQDRDAVPLPPQVLDLGEDLTDLADTAAIMSGLDLMISSCTATLHLAGALGVRTWAMIPFAPYFPWLLERTDTPWYPTMRLYRQDHPGRDWSAVVGRIAVDLSELVRSSIATHELSAERTGGCNELAPCRDGMMLFNRNDIYISASLRKYGEFSGEESALFRLIVQPGWTALDVGANIGAHTIDLSRLVGATGIVYAFEPQRLVFQLLCANVSLNGRTNVFAHQAAIDAGHDTLLVPSLDPGEPNNYGGLSLLDVREGEPVPVVTIDGLDLRACQFMKLDVEGMETEALRGAAETIRRCRPFLYVENDRRARSAELVGLLQSYGYRLYWHLPPLYRADNFRGDTDNIFGGKVSVNMICIPTEIPQSLANLREVTGPDDSVFNW